MVVLKISSGDNRIPFENGDCICKSLCFEDGIYQECKLECATCSNINTCITRKIRMLYLDI